MEVATVCLRTAPSQHSRYIAKGSQCRCVYKIWTFAEKSNIIIMFFLIDVHAVQNACTRGRVPESCS